MLTDGATAEVLGIQTPRREQASLLWIAQAVTDGLPVSAMERVAHQVAPSDKAFAYRLVSRPTLARRRRASDKDPTAEQAVLSPDEGARVARLAEVWAMARDVWGSDEEARAFLFRPHPMLEGRCPVDVVLATEFGRPLVEGILGRLRYGSAA